MTEPRTLRTTNQVHFGVPLIDVSGIGEAGTDYVRGGRNTWSVEPIEFDTPEQARDLVGERLVLDVEAGGLFHAVGAGAYGNRLTVRVTGPATEPPQDTP
jgi:hypothetical protein